MPAPAIRRALISVFDKTGVVEFARALHDEFGVEIISTGGTAKVLTEAGIPVTLVETLTGCGEMLDGRVKTLHPAIHAAILADRDNAEHIRQLAAAGIQPIDMVVVNLYPFEKTVADPNCTFEQAIEMIDIGGVALLRAAAKNHKHVVVLSDIEMYWVNPVVWTADVFRHEQASRAYRLTTAYDAAIATFLCGKRDGFDYAHCVRLIAPRVLRYGENAHSRAAAYEPATCYEGDDVAPPKHAGRNLLQSPPISGGAMSYNNYLDADAALGLCAELAQLTRHQLSPSDSPTVQPAVSPAVDPPVDPAVEPAVDSTGKPTVTHRLRAGAPPLGHRFSTGESPLGHQLSPGAPPLGHRLSAGESPLGHRFSTGESPLGHRLSAGDSISDEQVHVRNLPHIQRPDATYLLTFRLRQGQLSPPERDLVAESILFAAGAQYAIHGAVVMPDHVHMLLTPLEHAPRAWVALGTIVKGIKGSTARKINQGRGASGSLWMDEYWDTIIRDDRHLRAALNYLHENAERAGIEAGRPYPWCVVDPETAWNQDQRSAAISSDPTLTVGVTKRGAVVEARMWHTRINDHRLRVGAPLHVQDQTTGVGAPLHVQDQTTGVGAPLHAQDQTTGVGAPLQVEDQTTGVGAPLQVEDQTTGVGAPLRAQDQTTGVGAPLQVQHQSLRAGAPPNASTAVCCFVKHTNACGVGVAATAPTADAQKPATRDVVHAARVEAYRRAYLGDPNAAMGGILAVSFVVDAEFAAVVMETYGRFGKPLKEAGAPHAPGGFFVEVWIAPSFTDDAVAIIRGAYDPATATPGMIGGVPAHDSLAYARTPLVATAPGTASAAGTPATAAGAIAVLEPTIADPPRKKWGESVRLLAVGDMTAPPDARELQYRSIAGGMLVQSPDVLGVNEDDWKVVTERAPTDAELADLRLAWLICKHTKSNAITLVKDGMLIGNGAGQMSRVMSCRVAAWLARENGHLAERSPDASHAREQLVAASDAFFPFPDGPRMLIDAGTTAIIQPGGGKRDPETIDLCNQRGVAMIVTQTRHFRH